MIDTTKIIEIIYQAGKNSTKHFGNVSSTNYKTSHITDSVTNLDLETEIFIEAQLKKIDASIGFKGIPNQQFAHNLLHRHILL